MNFKRFTLLTLAASLMAVGVFFLSNSKEARYFPRNSGQEAANSAAGYLEYIKSIKANQVTGTVSPEDVYAAEKQASKLSKGKASLGINWNFKGPDNIGGRTRALIVDKNNSNHLLAGGVAGGVYESFDAGQTWNVYDTDYKVKNISCITQGADGSFYVGTGGHFETGAAGSGRGYYFLGSGIHKLTGNGNFETIVAPLSRLSSAGDWATVGQVEADPNDANILYAAMNNGFRKIDMSTNPATITDPIGFNQQANDVDVTTDGKVIVSYQGGRIYASHDNGDNFFFNSFSGVGRIEISVAPSNSNIIYAGMAKTNTCLFGIFRSKDGGITWDRISPEGSNSFDMYANPGVNCQGYWDNTVAVYPNNPGRIVVGGVTLYRWEQSSTDPAPPNGSWNQIDVLFSQQPNGARVPFYVHADKHRIVFDPSNPDIAYIANDGGVYKTTNFTATNPTYSQYNFNFRVTQYYGLGVGPNDVVLGGTQDNGSHLVGLKFNNNLGGIQVLGGDGFDAEMSVINPTIGVASSQFGRIARIQGIGTTTGNSNLSTASITNNNTFLGGVCNSPAGCSQAFYTLTEFWESFDHAASRDSVDIQVTEKLIPPIQVGREFKFFSNNSSTARQIEETYTVTSPINPTDTLVLGDLLNSVKQKNLSQLGTLTQIVNYDTMTVNPTAKTVDIRRPNGNNQVLSFTLGANVQYTNQYLSPRPEFAGLYFNVDSINGDLVLEVIEPQIDFYYSFKAQDRVQSMLVTANWPGQAGNMNERNVYITRDILKNNPDIKWYSIAGSRSTPDAIPNQVNIISAAVSADGNYVFLGSNAGDLYRISDVNSISDNLPVTTFGSWYDVQLNQMAGKCRKIAKFTNRSVTDIAVDPNNPDNVVVSLGNYGNGFFVARTTIATTANSTTGTFTTIQGVGANQLPKAPAYTVLFDKDNINTLLVGTEIGVFATENAFETNITSDTLKIPADTTIRTQDTLANPGSSTVLSLIIDPLDSLVTNDTVIYFPADTQYVVAVNPPDTTIFPARNEVTVGPDVRWTEEVVGMGRVPVFALEQMKFDYTRAGNDGKIYAATHGRGIFESGKFVGVPELEHNTYKASFKSSLQFYPNPVRESASLEFNLAENGAVQVQVYDIKGQLMRENRFANLNRGNNKVNMNFADMNNGTYIIRVINNNEVVTKKFVLYR